jgi:hypothetical protein
MPLTRGISDETKIPGRKKMLVRNRESLRIYLASDQMKMKPFVAH